MRYLFTTVVLFALINTAFAGNGGCGTVKPANHQFYTSDLQRSIINPQRNDRGAFRYVPVAYHIVTKDNGTGGITVNKVLQTHCMLNIGFEQPEMYFYIYTIDTISDDQLWAMSDGSGGTDYSLGYNAFRNHNIANVVNVYITGQLPQLCGFATFPNTAPSGGGLFLNASCCGTGEQTIPHEMGHYFNLDHTFNQTNPVEYVTRTVGVRNCATKGDGFCDTPADPSESRANCPYNSTATDPRGDVYNPDETLFMSYFNDNCLSTFSQQQQDEMNSTLSSARANLLNGNVPDVTPLNAVTFISPTPADSLTISANITFKWNSVPRAKYYLFHMQPATTSQVLVDTLLTDTVFNSGGLTANKSFRYYVRPISFGNVCESDAPYQFIKTTPIRATVVKTSPTCAGSGDGSIQITPSNGAAPYTINWSNSQSGNTNSFLTPGNYSVTITDNNGKVATATYEINDPAPVTASINKTGNDLSVIVSGGTAPYSYTWSNGVTSATNSNVTTGNVYSVTISDANGCSATETFGLTSSGIDLATRVYLKVFPNPAVNATEINLQISLNERTEATVSVINVNGEVVQSFRKEFQAGLTNQSVPVNQLPAGIYFIQFRGNEVVKTERISLMK